MKPQTIRWISFGVAVIFALPLPLGIATGLYLWLSPYLFLHSVLAARHLVLFHALAVAVALAAVWKHRFFCHWVCPTGALCDAASRCGRKTNVLQSVPALHKIVCMVALIFALCGAPILICSDPVNLFYAFFDALYGVAFLIALLKFSGLALVVTSNFLVPNIWCRRLCPLGGLQDWLNDAKRLLMGKPASPFNHKRRLVFGGVFAAGSAFALKAFAKVQSAPLLRPPSSQPEALFKTLCARCGNCTKACPAKIITPSFQVDDLLAALTPRIQFEDTFCPPDCVQCGAVCPSGAIENFSIEDKTHLVIGLAVIDQENCLLAQNKECDLCKTYCPYNAIAIKESEFDFSSYPEVNLKLCVGCGACEIICPVKVIEIVPQKIINQA